ncbi:MAG: hypothetical protein ABI406_04225, partial [Ktedonobacteraceae bacterium]
NAALSERRDAYQYTGKGVTYHQQAHDLPAIKHEIRPEYADIAVHVLQDVLQRLEKAFAAFFRRLKEGQTPGYPRFQGRHRYTSLTYPDSAGWKLENRTVTAGQKACNVKLHRLMHLPILRGSLLKRMKNLMRTMWTLRMRRRTKMNLQLQRKTNSLK